MEGDHILETSGLTKAYGHRTVLRDVNLTIGRGEVLGYLGPNGAGKTTTLRLLMGLLRPTAGRARVLGMDCWSEAVAVHRRVGYMSGEPAFYGRLTGRQHVRYLGRLRRVSDDKQAMLLAHRLDLDLDRPVRQLSKGNRQKLAAVLALMSGPDLLVLDEPTSGLDPLVQQEFHAIVREHTNTGGSVLLSSHVLGEVDRIADRIGVLRDGRLIAVERMADLRAKSLHHVSASFDDDVDVAEFNSVPGVLDVTVTARSLTCSAPRAALDALLKRIAAHDIVDMSCAEAELDDMFLAYYGAGESDAA